MAATPSEEDVTPDATRLDEICQNLKAKANAGTLVLQDEATAMDEFRNCPDALWRIAEACTSDTT
jgi:hypothetical protein